MKFKSIQFSVAALAGSIVLSIVAALVLYAVYSGARTQTLVHNRTQQQFEAFEGCTNKAEKARFYIRESRAGR